MDSKPIPKHPTRMWSKETRSSNGHHTTKISQRQAICIINKLQKHANETEDVEA